MIFAYLLAFAAPLVNAQSGLATQPIEICTVTSNAAKFDGEEITVRALWRMVIHGSILMGDVCPKALVNLTQTQGYKADKKASSLVRSLAKKDQFGSVEVVFRGTFRAAHERQCFGQICARYQFEADELLSAQLPSPTPSAVPDARSPDTLLHESGHADPPKPQ
jgi:hypothetical protein